MFENFSALGLPSCLSQEIRKPNNRIRSRGACGQRSLSELLQDMYRETFG